MTPEQEARIRGLAHDVRRIDTLYGVGVRAFKGDADAIDALLAEVDRLRAQLGKANAMIESERVWLEDAHEMFLEDARECTGTGERGLELEAMRHANAFATRINMVWAYQRQAALSQTQEEKTNG